MFKSYGPVVFNNGEHLYVKTRLYCPSCHRKSIFTKTMYFKISQRITSDVCLNEKCKNKEEV